MISLRALLAERVTQAFEQVGLAGAPPVIQLAAKPEFGDYQANGVMGAAKRLGENPRAVAQRVVEALDLSDIASDVSIAGPGFINVTFAPTFLAARLAKDISLSVSAPKRVVVDYSSPNLAKEMHVGHLRSTIIGDAVARVLEALGHTVIRQNHVGDWGTQFGMLLCYVEETGAGDNASPLADLEDFYRAAKKRFDEDADFAERARQRVVELQGGEAEARLQWQRFIDISLAHCQAVYDRLGVKLDREDVHAESAYNDELDNTLTLLQEAGVLTESDGAQCVFLDEFKGKDGTPLPVIVQKSDGGYLYATTDLAAVRYRQDTLKADRVLVFTDTRQALHFKQVFAVARAAGFADESISLEHMPFGAMLGADGKPFKTRSGGVIRLAALLDEAVERASALVLAKNPEITAAEQSSIAEAVGIGAIKYADLSKNRTSDYVFDWDQMLSFDGNTAPYLQYAYARIRSLFRRSEAKGLVASDQSQLDAPSERLLALALLRFPEVVEQVGADASPHHLCGYLFELAQRFTSFYEACPVLTADTPEQASSRLALCARTANTLASGLDLLGIDVIERM
ncbi:MAG: arginine--tRNA ligase [Pseudomonadaceae bacterium]|nr:arginine--tRNA ligase [Pseudomonadaceae bacterium]